MDIEERADLLEDIDGLEDHDIVIVTMDVIEIKQLCSLAEQLDSIKEILQSGVPHVQMINQIQSILYNVLH